MTLANIQITTGTRLIRRREVQARTGLGASSIYALMTKGKFPKPIKLSERRVSWIESEIDEWIADRIASSSLVGEDK